MNKTRFQIALVCAAFIFGAATLHAQATRTWVSGVGDDVNPCSRTAPCKTFAGAISKTATGGEINALDPAGYGTLTITKSITVDGGTGSGWASVLNSIGQTGFIVNVTVSPSSAVVILRNITINGASKCTTGGCAGLKGIRWIAGNALHVENCVIENQATVGMEVVLAAAGQLYVQDTNFTNTTAGMTVTSTVSFVSGQIEHCRFMQETDGINTTSNAFLTVRDSYFGAGAGGNGAVRANTGCQINVANSTFANNVVGVNQAGGALRITNNEFFNNATAIVGTAESANNNKFRGNTTDGAVSNVIVVK
jgi:hypothetical protein